MHFAPFLALCLAAVVGVHAEKLQPFPVDAWRGTVAFTDENTLLYRYCANNPDFSCVSLYVFNEDRIPHFAHRDAGRYRNTHPVSCAYREHSLFDAFNDASTTEYLTCAFYSHDTLFTINCNDTRTRDPGVEAVFSVELEPSSFELEVLVGPNNTPPRRMRHLFFNQSLPDTGTNYLQYGNNNGPAISVENVTNTTPGIDLAVACAI